MATTINDILKMNLFSVDTSKMMLNTKAGKQLFTGYTNKAGATFKAETLDIKGDWGNALLASIPYNYTAEFDSNLVNFNLGMLEILSNNTFKTTDTDVWYFEEDLTVTTNTTTIIGLKQVSKVTKVDGTPFKIVAVAPADATEVQVDLPTGKLTFHATMTDTKVVGTYVAPVATGKAVASLEFNGNRFAPSANIALLSPLYDGDTNEIKFYAQLELFSVALTTEYSLNFEAGKNQEMPVKGKIIIPQYITDSTGAYVKNTKQAVGLLKIIEA